MATTLLRSNFGKAMPCIMAALVVTSACLWASYSCNSGACSLGTVLSVKFTGVGFESAELGGLEKIDEDDPSLPGNKKYKGPKIQGGRQVTLAAPTERGTTKAELSVCGADIFVQHSLKKGKAVYGTLWKKMGTTYTVYSSRESGSGVAGGGTGNCDDPSCIGGQNCRCSCYSPEKPPSTRPKYTKYKKAARLVITVGPEDDMDELIREALNEDSRRTVAGFDSNGNPVIMDGSDVTEVSIPDDDTTDAAELENFMLFNAGLVEPTEEEIIPGAPETFCQCAEKDSSESGTGGTGSTSTAGSVAKPFEFKLLVLPQASSAKNDRGAHSSSGPGGGSASSGGESQVPLNISFGLGRNQDGNAFASFEYSSTLDDPDPLASGNFELYQPIFPAGGGAVRPGSAPQGIDQRYVGPQVVLDLKKQGDSQFLTFRDPGSLLVDTEHVLTRTTGDIGTMANVPGIIHTITKGGVTSTTTYLGLADGNGGKIWRVEQADGSIEEGQLMQTATGRTQSLRLLRRSNMDEVLIQETIEEYQQFSFGEKLVRRVVENGNHETQEHQYAYELGLTATVGRLSWQIEPDGSWVKNEYHPSSGRLFRQMKPWQDSPAHPQNATYENSACTTYLEPDQSEAWTIESVLGVVVSRSWNRTSSSYFDWMTKSSLHAWNSTPTTIELPTSFHDGDRFAVGKQISVSSAKLPSSIYSGSFQGTVSDALSMAFAAPVEYDEDNDRWTVFCKNPLPQVHVHDWTSGQSRDLGGGLPPPARWQLALPAPYNSASFPNVPSRTYGWRDADGNEVVRGPLESMSATMGRLLGAGVGFSNGVWNCQFQSRPPVTSLYEVQEEVAALPASIAVTVTDILGSGEVIIYLENDAAPNITLTPPASLPRSGPDWLAHWNTQIMAAGLSGILMVRVEDPVNAPDTLVIETVQQSASQKLRVLYGIEDFTTYDSGWLQGQNYSPAVWTKKAEGAWQRIMSDPNAPPPPSLADLRLFEGRFDSSMSQRFTADYSRWSGSLSLTDPNTGRPAASISSDGNVTHYSYQDGLYQAATNTFAWGQPGEALKVETKRFAANPTNFVLLAADPVTQVSMTDYQGQSRTEQTWKGGDMVMERTHEYDASTRDRLWTKEGAVKIYEAMRDTTANTLTEADASGTQTRTAYTMDGQMAETRKIGHDLRPDIISDSEEIIASDGRITTTSTTTAGGLQRRSSSTVDGLGRMLSTTDENGFTTTYSYPAPRKTVETRPDGSTRITENYLDGRLKSVTGTGVIAEYHTYSVDEDGNLTETVYLSDDGSGTTRSPRWRSSTTNGIGWLIAESQPAPPAEGAAVDAPRGVLTTRHFYNTKGQRIRTERPGQPDLLFTYDVFGRQETQGIDINDNGTLQTTGTDKEPVTSTTTTYEKMGALWFEKTVTTETTSSSTLPRTRTSLRLLGGSLMDMSIEYTSDGLCTTTTTSRNPVTKTVTTTIATNQTASGQATTRTVVNGLLLSETVPGATGSILYDYDELERPTLVTELAGIQRKTVYADVPGTAPELTTARSLVWKEQTQHVADNNWTTQRTYAYHSTAAQPGYGRVSTITQADSTTLTYTYDLLGRQTFTSGSGTYPVRYEYDAFGELEKMHTFRSGTPTATSTGDVTTWTRDPATGMLLSKTDAASKGVTTTYDPATGRLWKRTLARKGPGGADITITYDYDDAGRLEHIDYSDATPDVTHTYHADGQLKTTQDAAGLHTYQYTGPGGQLSGETITGGLLGGSSWSTSFVTQNGVNGQNLRDEYTWAWTGAGTGSMDYDYDNAGRLWKVKAFGHTATYGYHPVTGRKETLAYSGAGLTGTWAHDTKGRLESLTWRVGANVLSQHAYGFDDLHRRTHAERETGEIWHYDYNDRGEVESAVKKVDDTPAAAAKRGLQSGYGYDLIGNRTMDKQHTPTSGSGLSEAVWTANALNQIEEREHHDSRWIFGHVKAAATLTVTGQSDAVIREGEEFAIPVSRTGTATDADWHSLNVTASLAGAGREVNGTPMDVTTQRQGKVWFPASPESLAYDDDGNLYQDGRWELTWNAENRLTRAETRADVATTTGMPRQRLDFAYDAIGRRIRKAVSLYQPGTANSEPSWKLLSDLRFLYEATSWNLVAEIEMVNPVGFNPAPKPNVIRRYAWGTDLSGNATGAGGVGGLLLVQSAISQLPSPEVFGPCYDGNGNISAYVRVTSGTVTSKHDYDAFGRPVWNELEGTGGRQMAASPFGFSTKYTDSETEWVYYGFRYYSPEMGRWLSRDPIEEQGGINLYKMIGGDAVNAIDVLGLKIGSSYDIALVSQILCQEKKILLRAPGIKPEPTNYKNSLAKVLGAVGQWFTLLGVSSYANDTTATAYAIGTARLLDLREQGILREQEVRKYIREVDISRDARALKGKLDEMWSKLEKVMPDDKKPYRGRIQAQRNKPEFLKREMWARLFPVTQKEGQLYMNLIWRQLGGKDQEQFGPAMSAARQWINKGPHFPPGLSFLVVRYHSSPNSVINPENSRIDIEINRGETFVP